MEPRFGRDFSGVRVHTDSAAAESARAVNANAYTVGQHIVFDEGKYNPSSTSGKQLLAHELAHTVQQHGLRRSAEDVPLHENGEYHRLEREAETAAGEVVASPMPASPLPTTAASRPMLSRAERNSPGSGPSPKGNSNREWEDVKKGPLKTAGAKQIAWAPEGSVFAEVAVNMGELPLPAKKGDAEAAWNKLASAGGLETVVEVSGSARPKVAVKQGRPDTSELKRIWLQKVGWKREEADKKWRQATKDKTDNFISSATAKGDSCHVDHIVELQFGGDNAPGNLQMLDGPENMSSGAQISTYLKDKAESVRSALKEEGHTVRDIILHYDSVDQPKAVCKACCKAEDEAQRIGGVAEGESVGGAKGDPYQLAAGGRETTLFITGKKKAAVPILESEIPENVSSATLIPGLLLEELLLKGGPGKDLVHARFDTEKKETGTRLPLDFRRYKKSIVLHVQSEGVLKLDTKNADLKFDFGYLSPGAIKALKLEPDNTLSGTGVITPTVKFLPELQVVFDRDSFKLVAALDAKKLKSPFPGAKFTKGSFDLQISPAFKPEAELEMVIGPENKPLATANVHVEPDEVGVVASFKLTFHIPKMETAETTITYRGGGGRDEWAGAINIESKKINLGPSVSVSGGFNGQITSVGLDFAGKIDATFPNNNTAELGLKKKGEDWILSGGGKFHFPKLDETNVHIDYDLGKDVLTATGNTGFTLEALNLKGRLEPVTFVIDKGGPPKVSGTGTLNFEKGKAKGEVKVHLHPSGKFTGKGSLSYKIKENIIVTGTVELNEQEKLRVTGELLVTRFELFKQYGDKKDLFTVDFPIPVPGLSIGTSGVVFHIRGGVGVAYSFGPGVLEPLKFSAGFDPLEADPDLELAVTGSLKIPASASLSAFIEGSLAVQVDVYVGSAGAEGGLRLTGELRLDAGAFADFEAAYKKKHLTAKMTAGIKTQLLLGISLTAFVHAWAGAFGFKAETRKDWTLAKKVIDTGIGFFISAPFEYSDETGVKLPEFKDITLKKPDITSDNMKRILGEIFGSSSEKTVEK
jgi:hypothetical protein